MIKRLKVRNVPTPSEIKDWICIGDVTDMIIFSERFVPPSSKIPGYAPATRITRFLRFLWNLEASNRFYNISEKPSLESKNRASEFARNRYVTVNPARFQNFENVFAKIRKREQWNIVLYIDAHHYIANICSIAGIAQRAERPHFIRVVKIRRPLRPSSNSVGQAMRVQPVDGHK